jgi:hypothetical protein
MQLLLLVPVRSSHVCTWTVYYMTRLGLGLGVVNSDVSLLDQAVVYLEVGSDLCIVARWFTFRILGQILVACNKCFGCQECR